MGSFWREKKRMIETENPRIFWRRIALGPCGWLTLAINHLLRFGTFLASRTAQKDGTLIEKK